MVVEYECKNAFSRSIKGEKVDYIAMKLILHIFGEYKKTNTFPDKEVFIQ